MNRSIAFIGAGATCLSMLHFYLKEYRLLRKGEIPSTIFVFEKRESTGTGVAYESDVSSNILNTKSGSVSPFHDRPGDFYKWAKNHSELIQSRFPDYELAEDSYAPRPLFGLYAHDKYKSLVLKAAALNVRVVTISAEVIDLIKIRDHFVLSTDSRIDVAVDYVFLLCGTLPIKQGILADGPACISNPYPLSKMLQRVSRDDSVAIIGARLSCIDTVIALVENGHKGKVFIFSRSGYFPSVRGTQGRIQTNILKDEYFDNLLRRNIRLSLSDFARLFQLEVESQGGKKTDLDLPSPPQDIKQFLRGEIEKSTGPRLWQAALYATNRFVGKIWRLLPEDEKKLFLRDYMSVFMAYRVSIPRENAKKILGYLERGAVEFIPGKSEIIGLNDNSGTIKTAGGDSLTFDKIISAVGSPRDITQLDSSLLSNLIKREYIGADRYGGLLIDQDSYEVIRPDGKYISGLYALGELTNGAFFFTSALEINSYHVETCCRRFVRQVSDTNAGTHIMPESSPLDTWEISTKGF